MNSLWVLPAAAVVSFVLTALIRRYAVARQLLDIPNHRSSHRTPTPRGGGVAIVLTVMGSLLVVSKLQAVHQPLIMAVCIGGGWVALIGFIDDHKHVSPAWRLVTQAFGVVGALYWLGDTPVSAVAEYLVLPKLVVYSVGVVCVLWCVNLYNFMDGIDGIASIEAITVCIGGALLYLLALPGSDYWIVPAVLAASASGFLFWNYPPARIFMGDVGSGFVGFMMAVFLISAGGTSLEMTSAWLILLAVFFVDATCTVLRRLARGEKIAQPHRSHAYQYASRLYGNHAVVSLMIGAINLFFLAPVALLVVADLLPWPAGMILAYAPIIGLALWFKAGAAASQASR